MVRFVKVNSGPDDPEADHCAQCSAELSIGNLCRYCGTCGAINPNFAHSEFQELYDGPVEEVVELICSSDHSFGEMFALFMGEVMADYPLEGGEILYQSVADREEMVNRYAETFMPNRTSLDPLVQDNFCVYCGKPFKKQLD